MRSLYVFTLTIIFINSFTGKHSDEAVSYKTKVWPERVIHLNNNFATIHINLIPEFDTFYSGITSGDCHCCRGAYYYYQSSKADFYKDFDDELVYIPKTQFCFEITHTYCLNKAHETSTTIDNIWNGLNTNNYSSNQRLVSFIHEKLQINGQDFIVKSYTESFYNKTYYFYPHDDNRLYFNVDSAEKEFNRKKLTPLNLHQLFISRFGYNRIDSINNYFIGKSDTIIEAETIYKNHFIYFKFSRYMSTPYKGDFIKDSYEMLKTIQITDD